MLEHVWPVLYSVLYIAPDRPGFVISIRGTDPSVPTKPSCTCSAVASPPYPGCQSDISSSPGAVDSSAGSAHQICVADKSTAARWAADGSYPPGSTCPTRLVCSEPYRSVWTRSHHIGMWGECCGFVLDGECSTRLGMSLSSPCNVGMQLVWLSSPAPFPFFPLSLFPYFLFFCSSHRVISGRSGIIP